MNNEYDGIENSFEQKSSQFEKNFLGEILLKAKQTEMVTNRKEPPETAVHNTDPNDAK